MTAWERRQRFLPFHPPSEINHPTHTWTAEAAIVRQCSREISAQDPKSQIHSPRVVKGQDSCLWDIETNLAEVKMRLIHLETRDPDRLWETGETKFGRRLWMNGWMDGMWEGETMRGQEKEKEKKTEKGKIKTGEENDERKTMGRETMMTEIVSGQQQKGMERK